MEIYFAEPGKKHYLRGGQFSKTFEKFGNKLSTLYSKILWIYVLSGMKTAITYWLDFDVDNTVKKSLN